MADQLQTVVQRMIDAGEPEENIAAVIQHMKASPSPAQPMVRSRTGQMYTPPTDSGLKDFGQGALSVIDPRTYINLAKSAYQQPAETAKGMLLSPLRMAGELVTNPARTLGTLTTGAAINAATGAMLPKPPEMVGGVPLADLKAAGVGDQSLDLMRVGRPQPKPMPSGGVLRTTTAAPPTMGNLALKTEDALAPPSQAAKTVPSGFNPRPNPIDQMVATQSRNEAFDRVAQKQGMAQPNAMTPMAQRAIESIPNRLTPEQMDRLPSYAEQMRNPDRHGQLGSDWMSFAEPGSADAQRAAASHKYQGEMDSRWRYLMDSEKGSISPHLLTRLGLMPVRYGAAAWTAKELGLPAWAGPAGLGAADLARASPQTTQALVRAAILARLAGGDGNTATPTAR